jgi:hypothetical protein
MSSCRRLAGQNNYQISYLNVDRNFHISAAVVCPLFFGIPTHEGASTPRHYWGFAVNNKI